MADETKQDGPAKSAAAKKVTVTCIKAGWVHAGKDVPVDETVEVDADQAKRVRDAGFAK